MILSQEEIDYLKKNQHEITVELIDLLRNQKEDTRDLVQEILDTPKDEKQYYLDVYGDPISFDGRKTLKKQGTIMPLHPIHFEELKRCMQDFDYFRNNYIKIKTKSGIGYPELRPYQERFIRKLVDPNNDEIVGLMGRQCIHAQTRVTLENNCLTIEDLWNLE